MLKKLLFFYPFDGYWNEMTGKTGNSPQEKMLRKLEEYRQRGYEINWLFFSDTKNQFLPDMVGMDCFVLEMRKGDKIIPSGKSVYEFSENKYPDGRFIIKMLGLEFVPAHIILAGFHEEDCLARFEEYLEDCEDLISVSVDSDLTDKAFI